MKKWTLLALLFTGALVADQTTKFLAVDRLTVTFERAGATTLAEKVSVFYRARYLEGLAKQPYTVLRPLWRMTYVENPGAAWGMFRGLSDSARNTFFTLISIAAVIFILFYFRRLHQRQRYLQVALSLVLAGAVGNFVDRLARRYVIDFIQWHWWNRPDLYWPIFNLADSLIVVGVLMLLVHPGQKRAEAGNKQAAIG